MRSRLQHSVLGGPPRLGVPSCAAPARAVVAMGEGHAYGWSLGCINRRLFVLGVSAVMLALCLIQLARWVLSFRLWDAIMGNSWKVEAPAGCIGTQCWEVLTCFGMKDASLHVREPLVTLAGVIMLPAALSGAHHSSHRDLRVAAVFFIATAVLHIGVLAADAIYFGTCGSYPTNIIYQTMLNWMPPSPLNRATQAKLQAMSAYSVEDVAQATHDFQVLTWYFVVAGLLAAFLLYVAREVWLLGDLSERGPLGLGMHFGLNRWDEVLDHDALRRHRMKGTRSAFLDDATLTIPGTDLESSHLGVPAYGGGYGAIAHLAKFDVFEEQEDEEAEQRMLEINAALDHAEAEEAAAAAAAAAAEEAEARSRADQRLLLF